MIDFIPHDIAIVLGYFITFIMMVLMLDMSIDDIKHTRIKAWQVAMVYLLVMAYVSINNLFSPTTTTSFLIILIIFTTIAGLSKGKFGMGDALMLGALGWYFASLGKINVFLYAWAAMSFCWAIFWIIYLYNKSDIRDIVLGYKKTIPIYELKAGMILAKDNFVKGLTEKEISDLCNTGVKEVEIKKPLPYIPCIFFAFLIAIFL